MNNFAGKITKFPKSCIGSKIVMQLNTVYSNNNNNVYIRIHIYIIKESLYGMVFFEGYAGRVGRKTGDGSLAEDKGERQRQRFPSPSLFYCASPPGD